MLPSSSTPLPVGGAGRWGPGRWRCWKACGRWWRDPAAPRRCSARSWCTCPTPAPESPAPAASAWSSGSSLCSCACAWTPGWFWCSGWWWWPRTPCRQWRSSRPNWGGDVRSCVFNFGHSVGTFKDKHLNSVIWQWNWNRKTDKQKRKDFSKLSS